MTTNRSDFNATWLLEMPKNIGSFQLFDMLEYNIKDRVQSGSNVADLGNGLKKIVGQQVAYYWYEDKGQILLGAELAIAPQGLVVTGLAKNHRMSGPPYASDLYDAILNDSGRSIKLLSDTDMSENVFEVWARLLTMGHHISVYDNSNPGQSFNTVNTIDELKKYFQDNESYRKFQFVLSESGEMLAETRSYFNTRRMRELAGLSLED